MELDAVPASSQVQGREFATQGSKLATSRMVNTRVAAAILHRGQT